MPLLKALKTFSLLGSLLVSGAALAQAPQATPAAKVPPTKMTPAASAPAAKSAATPLLDVNSASKEDLIALKGVGEKRAADIIKGRPYKGKDELVQKKIIPAAVYADIKDKIIAKQK